MIKIDGKWKHTLEEKIKISNKTKGRVFPLEVYKKIGNSLKNNGKIQKQKKKVFELYYKNSKNMSEVSRILNCSVTTIRRILKEDGINTSLLGKPKTEEHKLNFIKGMTKKGYWLTKGKKITEEHKKKIGLSKLGKKRPDLSILNRLLKKGKKQTQNYLNFRAKQILPKKDSSIEIKIQNFLKELGIEFFTHQYMKISYGYQCDILIPSMNLVIECDGDYWHKYPIGTEIDHIRTKELIEKGFKVLRLWEFEIRNMDLNKFKEKLNAWTT